jgi:hypothetical protein
VGVRTTAMHPHSVLNNQVIIQVRSSMCSVKDSVAGADVRVSVGATAGVQQLRSHAHTSLANRRALQCTSKCSRGMRAVHRGERGLGVSGSGRERAVSISTGSKRGADVRVGGLKARTSLANRLALPWCTSKCNRDARAVHRGELERGGKGEAGRSLRCSPSQDGGVTNPGSAYGKRFAHGNCARDGKKPFTRHLEGVRCLRSA